MFLEVGQANGQLGQELDLFSGITGFASNAEIIGSMTTASCQWDYMVKCYLRRAQQAVAKVASALVAGDYFLTPNLFYPRSVLQTSAPAVDDVQVPLRVAFGPVHSSEAFAAEESWVLLATPSVGSGGARVYAARIIGVGRQATLLISRVRSASALFALALQPVGVHRVLIKLRLRLHGLTSVAKLGV